MVSFIVVQTMNIFQPSWTSNMSCRTYEKHIGTSMAESLSSIE